jgi:hypothetical protein
MSKPAKSQKPLPPLPPGYIPPMPYADICPRCKTRHARNVFTFREGPLGGNDARVWGYFCEPCERTPFWLD